MNDITLLPLPEPMRVLGTRGKDAAEAWCRANVALAQQPAAVDEAMVDRALDAVFPPTFKRNDALRDMWRTGLTAALAAQHGGSDNG